ncbi:major facilitator superfamily domain-containing protein [Lipomyces doorenjongii]|uniref:major facilitator superfamily domain-containing protein n=1 Tax=Lipomyces doorenjongii TaxID=383834 RepID=UPI0034CD8C7A
MTSSMITNEIHPHTDVDPALVANVGMQVPDTKDYVVGPPDKLSEVKSSLGSSVEASEETLGMQVEPSAPAITFPDGGRQAWLCVVGAFCSQFCSFGWLNTCGVFQEYYLQHQLNGYSATTVSWISSLQTLILFTGSLIVGRLFDSYGPRYLLLAGTLLEVGGIMLTSICKTYGPILVCQGIVASMGAACVFNASVGSVSSWFKKKRARALGIMSSGSSLGGIVFPILIRRLTVQTTFGWTMRACGFLVLGLLIITNLTVTSNVTPRGKWIPLYPRDLWVHFKDTNYVLLATAFALGFVGFMLPFTYIVSSAIFHGMDENLANYLVSFLNAASIFGRIIPGIMADKVGQYNMNTVGIFLAGVVTLALWIPAQDTGSQIAFAVLYGFFSGTFVALIPACTAQISNIQDIGTRVGLMFFCLSLTSLAGVPIGGAIIGDATSEKRWNGMMAFAGSFLMVGGIFHWVARVKLVGPSLKAVC